MGLTVLVIGYGQALAAAQLDREREHRRPPACNGPLCAISRTRPTVCSRAERRQAAWRYEYMNARPTIHELDRIRRDIGARLRIEHEVAEPPPQLLMALLKELEIHEYDVESQRLFAQVQARADELLRAAGRQPGDVHDFKGRTVQETVPS